MILANVRASLGRDDAQLALYLIARGSASERERTEERLRDEGIDALLDDPRLLTALIQSPLGARASWPLFCYVVVRNAMRTVGENDRILSDYVASILLHFGLRDRASRIADVDDEQYDSLAALVEAVDDPDAQRSFLVRAHLGNYALWQSGLFPDLIAHRRWRRGAPDLDYYEDLGRRGFELAADHRLAQEHGLASLFREAAARFVVLRMALNSVSDALLFPHHNSADRLMRQVRDDGRWKLTS
ncbi:MAG TPA: hypothetical protein VJ596_03025 [Gemmatimonadaceae bacterium]|nr:hypothetical protein [Gemmatimonadaceae bacterium]